MLRSVKIASNVVGVENSKVADEQGIVIMHEMMSTSNANVKRSLLLKLHCLHVSEKHNK